MAKARTRLTSSSKGRSGWVLLALAVMAAGLGWHYRSAALGYAQGATAYSARVVCSCRFVAGRSLKDCEKDKIAGMELVTLVDDVRAKSVTARFPLLASDTARYRDGFGCVLQPWEG